MINLTDFGTNLFFFVQIKKTHMKLHAADDLIMIRIPKKEMRDRKEKINGLFIPPSAVFMTRECQAGQIESIGKNAQRVFPELKRGAILIHHHFVSGKQSEGTDFGQHYAKEDKEFKYYMVSVRELKGRANETFAVFDGKTITPHRDYILLEPDPKPDTSLTPEQFLQRGAKLNEKGVYVVEGREESFGEMRYRQFIMKQRVQELSKSSKAGSAELPEHIVEQILELQNKMGEISKRLNAKRFEAHKVFASNPATGLKKGDTVYALNLACRMQVEFMGVTFKVCQFSWVAFGEIDTESVVDDVRTTG